MFRDGVDIIDVLPTFISDLALALGFPEGRIDVAVLNDPLLPFEVRFRALTQGVPVYIGDRGGVFIREVVRAISLYGDYQVFLRVNGFNELIRRRLVSCVGRLGDLLAVIKRNVDEVDTLVSYRNNAFSRYHNRAVILNEC